MEEKIKVNPEDVTVFIKFVRNFFVFDEEKLITLRKPKLYEISIYPTSLLVPVYRYFPTPLGKKLGIEFKYEDKINIENLSYFRVFNLPENSDIKIDLHLEPAEREGDAIIWEVRVNINDPDYHFAAILDGWPKESAFIEDIRTIKWAKGRSYSKHSKSFSSKVTASIFRIEEYLFTLSSLLYVVYSGEYRKDKKEAELFAPFTEILRSYGETFEEALPSIKIAATFAF
jgi:hypothetical protein